MSFLSLATKPEVVKTAIKVALVVGSILVLINHAPKLMAGEVTAQSALQMLLTYLVPYCVSTYSAVKAMQRNL